MHELRAELAVVSERENSAEFKTSSLGGLCKGLETNEPRPALLHPALLLIGIPLHLCALYQRTSWRTRACSCTKPRRNCKGFVPSRSVYRPLSKPCRPRTLKRSQFHAMALRCLITERARFISPFLLPSSFPVCFQPYCSCDRAVNDTVQGQKQSGVVADMLAALRLERDQVHGLALRASTAAAQSMPSSTRLARTPAQAVQRAQDLSRRLDDANELLQSKLGRADFQREYADGAQRRQTQLLRQKLQHDLDEQTKMTIEVGGEDGRGGALWEPPRAPTRALSPPSRQPRGPSAWQRPAASWRRRLRRCASHDVSLPCVALSGRPLTPLHVLFLSSSKQHLNMTSSTFARVTKTRWPSLARRRR